MPSYHFFKQELELCTISSEGFRVLSQKILASLAESEVGFFSVFLKEISLMVLSKQQAPISRFYALYLLFKASLDLKTDFLLELLKQTALLTFIYHTAQYESSRRISLDERGNGFFSSSHGAKSNSRVGINFVRLSLEILTFWDKKYVSRKTSEHPSNLFRLYAKGLAKKLKLPLFYYFIEKSYDPSQDLATWDFSLKLPTTLSNEEIQSNCKDIPIDQEEEQLSCNTLPETSDFDFKRSLSLQVQDFTASAPKEDSDSNQVKPSAFEEEIPFISVARHQSEPHHIMHQLKSFQKWQGLEEEDNVFTVEQKVPTSATLPKDKNYPHFSLGSFRNLAKSDICQKTKLLSDLDEIEMSIKRSMHSSTKVQTTSTMDGNNTPQKCLALEGIRKTSRPSTVTPPKNSSLASLRLVSPQSVRNTKTEDQTKPIQSARKCFNFLKKDSNIIPSFSSIWDKEEVMLSSARAQRETLSVKPPVLKKSSSIVPTSLLDLELMLGRESSHKGQPACGKIEVIRKTNHTKREALDTFEKKKYDPFARERLVETL